MRMIWYAIDVSKQLIDAVGRSRQKDDRGQKSGRGILDLISLDLGVLAESKF